MRRLKRALALAQTGAKVSIDLGINALEFAHLQTESLIDTLSNKDQKNGSLMPAGKVLSYFNKGVR
ncbi:MAG: hypothetical protein JJ975_12800, partial [Bacteroidia bacterium]|nr:hypothetical protein [Bacteroidia bacterium]